MTDAPDSRDTADPTTGEIPPKGSTESEAEIDEAAVRSFATLLHEMRYGQCAVDASEQLAQVIAAVTETGKSGSISITFKFKPAGKAAADRRTLQVSDEIKVNLPAPEAESNLFYATASHGLSREDPRQQKFSLREVPPKAEVREGPAPAPVREVTQ